ncbi:MAG TPA: zf-HC2 domain-containing protein, partial [Myxococcales bacterium]|nr:zf-HC2 domain-containing protein [Myxococcales bacterium]
MNCAESHDLLLDLAYGELEPARAAEVEEHVKGCAECRAEKSQLDLARKLASPLREMEEPSANFDEPILRAARAEAGMQADGTPGPVVEVAASVKPLGLQAARLDPRAKVRGAGAPLPWWRRRAALSGSVAAAAAVILVAISVAVLRPDRDRVASVEVAPITVRAPGAPVPEALKDALAQNERRDAAAPNANTLNAAPPPPAAAPERKAAPAQRPAAPKAIAKSAQSEEQIAAGGGTASAVLRGNGVSLDDRKSEVAELDRAAGARADAALAAAPAPSS